MSNKITNNKTPTIVTASKEARELNRLRDSHSFRLGISMIKILKNPLRIIFLPFIILKLLFDKNKEINLQDSPTSGYFIIGLDRVNLEHSNYAESLTEIITKSDLGDVTLLNNSFEIREDLAGVKWYRIPAVRNGKETRKEWNILTERLLSSALSISKPSHIIYFGDYLYRGVIDSLELIGPGVQMTWFYQNDGSSKHIDNKKLPRMKPVLIPELNNLPPVSQSIHRILHQSEEQQILIVDIDKANNNLLKTIIEKSGNSMIAAIQRDSRLPQGIDMIVKMKDVMGMKLEGKICLIIDDKSPLLSSIGTLGACCLLVRTGQELSPIVNELISDLELNGKLVVTRRVTEIDIDNSVNYLKSLINETNYFDLSAYSEKSEHTNYVVKWIKKTNQSYN